MKVKTSRVKSPFSSIMVQVKVARLCCLSMYSRLDDILEFSINCMFVKTRSKILSERIARQTFMLLRWNYMECDLFLVKFTLTREDVTWC